MKQLLAKLKRNSPENLSRHPKSDLMGLPADSGEAMENPFLTQSGGSGATPVNPAVAELEARVNAAGGSMEAAGKFTGQSAAAEDPELAAADSRLRRRLQMPSLFRESYSLLAFQAGSFGLRGALIRNSRHYASIKAVAESRNVDFTRAIAEVLEQLRKVSKRLPRTAILLSPNVISSMVVLPVSPLRPRSDEKMQELIRWEMEGSVGRQSKQWLIGAMLVERGYLTAGQRDELVSELEFRQSQGGEEALIRFGDLAVELNYISREQLEECFALQGKLVSADDELVYGWQAEENSSATSDRFRGLSDEVLMSVEEDNDSAHNWLVSGMSQAVRRRWVGAFALNGIRLEAFYPVIGSAFATLGQRCDSPVQTLLEVHQEQIALIVGSPGTISEIRVNERLRGELRADECFDLIGALPAEAQQLYVASHGQDLEDLFFTLSGQLSIDIHYLQLAADGVALPEGLPFDALTGLNGAANHYLGHVPKTRLSWIAARDAETALWKRLLQPKVLATAGVLTLVAGAGGFLSWMHLNMWEQEQRLEELEARYGREMKLKKEFDRVSAENQELAEEIDRQRLQLDKAGALFNELQISLPHARIAVPALLKAVGVAITPGVQLQALSRDTDNVEITAGALSDTEGLEFVHALNQTLKPVRFQVADSEISRPGSDTPASENPVQLLLPYVVSVQISEDNQTSNGTTAYSGLASVIQDVQK